VVHNIEVHKFGVQFLVLQVEVTLTVVFFAAVIDDGFGAVVNVVVAMVVGVHVDVVEVVDWWWWWRWSTLMLQRSSINI
jgi:hypothetical protein